MATGPEDLRTEVTSATDSPIETKPEEIREAMEETRSALTEKLEALEQKVKDTVEVAQTTVADTVTTVKETVQETVQTVKRTFDLPYQVDRRPWTMMAASALGGYLVGRLMPAETTSADGTERLSLSGSRMEDGGSRMANGYPQSSIVNLQSAPPSPPPEPGFVDKLMDQFGDEIRSVKEMAIGTLAGVIRDLLREAIPGLAPQVGRVMDRVATKLGGEPIPGPVFRSSESSTSGYAPAGSKL